MISARVLFALAALALLSGPTWAHDDRGSFGDAQGVSGHYLGSAGADLWIDGRFGTGQILCDLEVAADDGAMPLNEAHVDGSVGGSAPDTWDDGGYGGACHTAHYTSAAYNTPGCPEDSAAYATDASLLDPWIAASCDWLTVQTGPFAETSACLVNAALGVDAVGAAWCALDDLACLEAPVCVVAASCGADGFADGILYGRGSAGIEYPSVSDPCAFWETTAAVFVWDEVDLDVNGLPQIRAATSGEIWQDWIASPFPLPERCVDGLDNDLDGVSDGADPDCDYSELVDTSATYSGCVGDPFLPPDTVPLQDEKIRKVKKYGIDDAENAAYKQKLRKAVDDSGITTREYVEGKYDCKNFAADMEEYLEKLGYRATFTCYWEWDPVAKKWRDDEGHRAHCITDIHLANGDYLWITNRGIIGPAFPADQDGDGKVGVASAHDSGARTEGNFRIEVYESRAQAKERGVPGA